MTSRTSTEPSGLLQARQSTGRPFKGWGQVLSAVVMVGIIYGGTLWGNAMSAVDVPPASAPFPVDLVGVSFWGWGIFLVCGCAIFVTLFAGGWFRATEGRSPIDAGIPVMVCACAITAVMVSNPFVLVPGPGQLVGPSVVQPAQVRDVPAAFSKWAEDRYGVEVPRVSEESLRSPGVSVLDDRTGGEVFLAYNDGERIILVPSPDHKNELPVVAH